MDDEEDVVAVVGTVAGVDGDVGAVGVDDDDDDEMRGCCCYLCLVVSVVVVGVVLGAVGVDADGTKVTSCLLVDIQVHLFDDGDDCVGGFERFAVGWLVRALGFAAAVAAKKVRKLSQCLLLSL